MRNIYIVTGCVGIGVQGAFESMQAAQQACEQLAGGSILWEGDDEHASAVTLDSSFELTINRAPLNGWANLC